MNRIRGFLQEYHPIVHSLLLGVMLIRIASSMSMPFLAIYLSTHTDMNEVEIGLTIGASSLAGTFGGFFGGALSDRIGRRKVMLAALYVWVLVFLGFYFARNPVLLFFISMLGGLCRSLYEPVSQALMADITPEEKRLRVFSLRYMAVNIGVSVGPLMGAYLGIMGGPVPFLITATIYFLYVVTLHVLLERFGIKQIEGQKKESVTIRSAWNVVSHDVAFLLFLVGAMLGAVTYSQMTVTLSQYLEKSFADGETLFAVLMSANAIVVVAMQMPLSRWAEKRTPIQSILAGSVFFCMGHLGFALATNWTTFIIAMVLFTIGEVLVFPTMSLFIDRLAPAHLRGTYFGAQTFANLGHFIGPILGGYLLAKYSGPVMFTVMAVLALVTTLFYSWGDRLSLKRSSNLTIHPQ